MNITKENAYAVLQEIEHQAEQMSNRDSGSFDEMKGKILQTEIVSAIQGIENERSSQRTDAQIFTYFANEGLTHLWEKDIDGKVVACEIHKEGYYAPLVKMPCRAISTYGLRNAIEYVMDMEEL